MHRVRLFKLKNLKKEKLYTVAKDRWIFLLYFLPPLVFFIFCICQVTYHESTDIFSEGNFKWVGTGNAIPEQPISNPAELTQTPDQIKFFSDKLSTYQHLLDAQPGVIELIGGYDLQVKYNIFVKMNYTEGSEPKSNQKTKNFGFTASCDKVLIDPTEEFISRGLKLFRSDSNDWLKVSEIVNKCVRRISGGFTNTLGHAIVVHSVDQPTGNVDLKLSPNIVTASFILFSFYTIWFVVLASWREGLRWMFSKRKDRLFHKFKA